LIRKSTIILLVIASMLLTSCIITLKQWDFGGNNIGGQNTKYYLRIQTPVNGQSFNSNAISVVLDTNIDSNYNVYVSQNNPPSLAGSTSYKNFRVEQLTNGKYYMYVSAFSALGNVVSNTINFIITIGNSPNPLPDNPGIVDLEGPVYSGNYLIVSNKTIEKDKTSIPKISERGLISINQNEELENQEEGKYYARPPLIYDTPITKVERYNYNVGDKRSFYAVDCTWYTYYKVEAELMHIGQKAEIWTTEPNKITQEKAKTMADEFDTKISAINNRYFGENSDVDKNGRIIILFLDIKDGYSGSGGYVAGYFNPNDLFDDSKSNKADMIYIDIYPTLGSSIDVKEAYGVIAHEHQHMIFFNHDILVEGNEKESPIWINEGFSEYAEKLYGYSKKYRIDYYNGNSAVSNGKSLIHWGQDGSTLANYAMSYLFVLWLHQQCGSDNIFKEVIRSTKNNNDIVTDVFNKYTGKNYTFGEILHAWRIAMLLRQDTGLYGFKGHADGKLIKDKTSSSNSVSLSGGGSVVIKINNSWEDKDSNSKFIFAGVNK